MGKQRPTGPQCCRVTSRFLPWRSKGQRLRSVSLHPEPRPGWGGGSVHLQTAREQLRLPSHLWIHSLYFVLGFTDYGVQGTWDHPTDFKDQDRCRR